MRKSLLNIFTGSNNMLKCAHCNQKFPLSDAKLENDKDSGAEFLGFLGAMKHLVSSGGVNLIKKLLRYF